MGYGVSYPGASLPRSVPKIIHTLIHEGGVPKEQLEWHGHNDFHKVLINGATAWLYGCAAVNGTLLGFGERTGNAPIEGLLIEYLGLTGNARGVDTRVITEMAEYCRENGDEDCAREAYTALVRLDPDYDKTAYYFLGALSEGEQAIAYFEKAVRHVVEAHIKLCIAYREAGETDKAIAACRRYLEVRPDGNQAEQVKALLQSMEQ